MITDLGSISLASACPWASTAAANITAACAIVAPNPSAQLEAMGTFQPKVSVGLQEMLTAAQAIVANIQAAIAAVPPIPTIPLTVQAQMGLSLKATLQTQLLTLQGYANFAGSLPTATARVLVYSGEKNVMGSELSTVLGAGAGDCAGVVFVATDSVGRSGLNLMFKMS